MCAWRYSRASVWRCHSIAACASLPSRLLALSDPLSLTALQAKASSFEKEVIMRASQAAAPLAMWVKANVRFSLVIEKIQPL